MASGASHWIANLVVDQIPAYRDSPPLIVAAIMVAAVSNKARFMLLLPKLNGRSCTTLAARLCQDSFATPSTIGTKRTGSRCCLS